MPRRSGPSSATPMRKRHSYSFAGRSSAARRLHQPAAQSAGTRPRRGWSAPPIRARPRPAPRCCGKGGSAADAAFATLLALNVVEPQSSGIGGGGYLVYSDQRRRAGDVRRPRDRAARRDRHLVLQGRAAAAAFATRSPGGKSVGVPGNIRMMALAHARYGKLPWAALFQPAIRLARDGFRSRRGSTMRSTQYAATGALSAAGARRSSTRPDGKPKPVGTDRQEPGASPTSSSSSRGAGRTAFYVGPNAQAIAATVSGAPHNPAPMTAGDVASYDAKPRPPVCGTYRGYRICGMGPSSSGGIDRVRDPEAARAVRPRGARAATRRPPGI